MSSKQLTQYFKVVCSSTGKKGRTTTVDITDYINEGLTVEDEDGVLSETTLELSDCYDLAFGSSSPSAGVMTDVLEIGMEVIIYGGTLTISQVIFRGAITMITPRFNDGGDITLSVKCTSKLGGKLSRRIRNLVYPSTNHPKTWAKTKALRYSEIIMNLCNDIGVIVNPDFIKVKHDKTAKLTGGVKQQLQSDWGFIQKLAKEINCTAWVEEQESASYLHLVDDSYLVSKISPIKFMYLSRTALNEFNSFDRDDKNIIQVISAEVELDPAKIGKVSIGQTSLENGKTQVTAEEEDANGNVKKWVLDEAKVRALSADKRQELIDLFCNGQVVWEADEEGEVSAKEYFKEVTIDRSSREGNSATDTTTEATSTSSVSSTGGVANGVQKSAKEVSYQTKPDIAAIKKLSPEQRSAVIKRIADGTMTEDDRKLYKIVEVSNNQESGNASGTSGNLNPNAAGSAGGKKKVKKRDSGFKVVLEILGDPRITTKTTHYLGGLGKYSRNYYLYRVEHIFGDSGYRMKLTFVK